ncbi:winged helix-turn-helix domain-containing protein [Pseudomonas viridiflava]
MINNRVGWSRSYLNKADLLTSPSKGTVQINDHGAAGHCQWFCGIL